MQKSVEFHINKSVLILANLFLKHLLILVLRILSKQCNNQYLPKSLIMKQIIEGHIVQRDLFQHLPQVTHGYILKGSS